MITSVSLIVWIFSAFYLTPFFFSSASKLEQIAFGAVTGIFFATWAAFVLFLLFGQGSVLQTVWFCLPFLGIAARYRFHAPEKHKTGLDRSGFSWKIFARAAGVLLWTGFWFCIARKTVFVTDQGVFTANPVNYGDIMEHIAFTQYFAWGMHGLQNPVFAGYFLKYHFLSNFMASLFVREGLSLPAVFQAQTFAGGLLLTWLCGIFVRRVTQSEACAWAAPFLFLTLSCVRAAFAFYQAGIAPPPVLENLLISRIIPQRSFLIGTPVFFCILTLLWEASEGRQAAGWRAAGILTGLLPLASAYFFLTAGFVGGMFSLMKGWRAFLNYALPLLLAAVLQILYLRRGGDVPSLHFIPGWYESFKNGPGVFLGFWLYHAGAVLPVILISWPFLMRNQALFFIPFALLFVLSNLVQVTPDMNCNYNIFYAGFAGMIPAILIFLSALWNSPRSGPVLAAFLFLLMTAGGMRQIKDTLWGKRGPDRVISAQAEKFSRLLREKTSSQDLVLVEPTWDYVVYWSGRQVLVGYPGWIWGHGWGDSAAREKAAKEIYEGGAEAKKYLDEFKISIIVVGPDERKAYKINPEFLKSAGGMLFDFPDYQVYRVRRPAAAA